MGPSKQLELEKENVPIKEKVISMIFQLNFLVDILDKIGNAN